MGGRNAQLNKINYNKDNLFGLKLVNFDKLKKNGIDANYNIDYYRISIE